jgi:YgiT-type zinc finger domain-containing protein
MKAFEKCPVCGGPIEPKQVEKLLRGGVNTVSIKVAAEVCLNCGERLYTEDVVRIFEGIRNKLQRNDFTNLKALGQSFTVEKGWPDNSVQPTA